MTNEKDDGIDWKRQLRQEEKEKNTDWEDMIDKCFIEVLYDFYSPLIAKKVDLVDKIKGMDTAYFDLITKKTRVSANFLERLKRGH